MELHQVYRLSSSDDVESNSVALTVLGELSAGRTSRGLPGRDHPPQAHGPGRGIARRRAGPCLPASTAQDFFQERPRSQGPSSSPRRSSLRPPLLCPLWASPQKQTRESSGQTPIPRSMMQWIQWDRENPGLYHLTCSRHSEGVISSFSLGPWGSRRERKDLLWRAPPSIGRGLFIDYDIGRVTLLNPEALFGIDPQGTDLGQLETEGPLPDRPPPSSGSMPGMAWEPGRRPSARALGNSRHSRTGPSSGWNQLAPIFLGGVNGDLTLGAGWLDRVMERLPGDRANDPASLRITGKCWPSPSRTPTPRGMCTLDDFDASDELSLSVLARDWHLGSAPEDGERIERSLPLSPVREAPFGLVWRRTLDPGGPGRRQPGGIRRFLFP